MSTLTQLAALRLQIAELMRTECAQCGHMLISHPISQRIQGTGCNHHHVVADASGDPAHARLVYCKCKAFCETTDIQEALKI